MTLNPSQGDYRLSQVAMAYLGRTPEGLEDRAVAPCGTSGPAWNRSWRSRAWQVPLPGD
ncbi:MAG: hypothetical protein ACLU9S_02825 [Oscillospiraceae bacterium]